MLSIVGCLPVLRASLGIAVVVHLAIGKASCDAVQQVDAFIRVTMSQDQGCGATCCELEEPGGGEDNEEGEV